MKALSIVALLLLLLLLLPYDKTHMRNRYKIHLTNNFAHKISTFTLVNMVDMISKSSKMHSIDSVFRLRSTNCITCKAINKLVLNRFQSQSAANDILIPKSYGTRDRERQRQLVYERIQFSCLCYIFFANA